VAFDNEAGNELFQWWYDMVHNGLALNVGWDPSGANGLLAVGAHKAVMVFSTSAAMRSIVDVLEQGVEGVDLGAAPVPGIPGRVPEGSPGVYSRSLWIMSDRDACERGVEVHYVAGGPSSRRRVRRRRDLPVRVRHDLPAAQIISCPYLLPADLFMGWRQPHAWGRSSGPSSRCATPSRRHRACKRKRRPDEALRRGQDTTRP
jgi:hypothetical protein